MPQITVVKEAVKESLVGAEAPPQLSAQTKARFLANAKKDAETGELYMGPEEFINAVAPKSEDYVGYTHGGCQPRLSLVLLLLTTGSKYSTRLRESSTRFFSALPMPRIRAKLP